MVGCVWGGSVCVVALLLFSNRYGVLLWLSLVLFVSYVSIAVFRCAGLCL